MAIEGDVTITRVFVAGSGPAMVPIPARAAERSHHFDVDTIIDGQELRFAFDWNGKYGFFSIEVLRRDGHIGKFYPAVDELFTVRNFNLSKPANPDAQIVLADIQGEGEAATPETLGEVHHLFVIPGKVVKT